MPFLAAQPTVCIKCHAPVAKGEPISWIRGKGAQPGVYHAICPQDVPAAVTFAPGDASEAKLIADELVLVETDDDDPLPEYEEPVAPTPGTRAWFTTATMNDRETQLVQASEHCVTIRDFNKVVIRYSTRLTDQETKRFRRYARGVWAGLTARFPDDDETDYAAQLRLFPESSLVTPHSEDTQAWRSLVAEWATVPE